MDNLAAGYTVLIVDDVPTNVMLVQAILKKEGYRLLTCDSGAKALRLAHDKHPHTIRYHDAGDGWIRSITAS